MHIVTKRSLTMYYYYQKTDKKYNGPTMTRFSRHMIISIICSPGEYLLSPPTLRSSQDSPTSTPLPPSHAQERDSFEQKNKTLPEGGRTVQEADRRVPDGGRTVPDGGSSTSFIENNSLTAPVKVSALRWLF